jgi:Tol biopolymer transport system component
VSQAGTLVYQAGGSVRSQLLWFDRAGRQIGTLGDPGDYGDVELSPDGTRAAVSLRDRATNALDLWLVDAARGLRTRFTFDPANEIRPIWSPDGTNIVFSSNRRGANDLYQKPSNGVGGEEILLQTEEGEQTQSWSTDGRYLLYYSGNPPDVWVLPLFGDRKPFPYLQTPAGEVGAKLSPDGRWVAYSSNEAGRQEIYIASFPKADGKWQVSTAGGSFSRWRRDGSELFFLDPGNKLMSAQVSVEGVAIKVGKVQPLQQIRANVAQRSSYDVSPDGQRFLINTVIEDATGEELSLVVNWTSLLKR